MTNGRGALSEEGAVRRTERLSAAAIFEPSRTEQRQQD